MAPQDLKDLGFGKEPSKQEKEQKKAGEADNIDWELRKKQGFVAGVRR